jgi:hypothetical protein
MTVLFPLPLAPHRSLEPVGWHPIDTHQMLYDVPCTFSCVISVTRPKLKQWLPVYDSEGREVTQRTFLLMGFADLGDAHLTESVCVEYAIERCGIDCAFLPPTGVHSQQRLREILTRHYRNKTSVNAKALYDWFGPRHYQRISDMWPAIKAAKELFDSSPAMSRALDEAHNSS